jgi:hypothetical protein
MGKRIRADYRAALAGGIPADIVITDLPSTPAQHD